MPTARGTFNPAVHRFHTVSVAEFPTPPDARVIQATQELEEFPFNEDMNSGYQLGIVSGISNFIFVRLGASRTTINNGSKSSSASTSRAHFPTSNGFTGPTPTTGNYMSITAAMVCPLSCGSMTLYGSDLFTAPHINPNSLEAELDVEAVRSALRFAAAPTWNDYIISPVTLSSNITDAKLEAYLHANSGKKTEISYFNRSENQTFGSYTYVILSMPVERARYSEVEGKTRVQDIQHILELNSESVAHPGIWWRILHHISSATLGAQASTEWSFQDGLGTKSLYIQDPRKILRIF
ncbi:hypothetical protein DFH07DRAFT_768002 [Mycena maculata]|uniref:Uncharacterized protein n=1 Tax=Mycena maculata TaxID=230809 RepID=A0AAD7JVM2_9AGAR|nr:hypothetical protein DFH07DRAFT_768002 [Mycena maculata]